MKRPPSKPRLKLPVCKPCWELKYCPYGALVELFPLISNEVTLPEVARNYKSWIDAVRSGRLKTQAQIYNAIEKILFLDPKSWSWISQFQTEELSCNVYGHICPVFFSAEPFTETKEG